MIGVGVSKDDREDVMAGSPDVIKLSVLDPGDYWFRIIAGGKRSERIFWPTVGVDGDSGEYVSAYKMVKRPPAGCILDAVAKSDKQAQIAGGKDARDARSVLTPSIKFTYLVFDRRDEGTEVKRLEVGFKVKKALSELEMALDEADQDKLKYGLIYLFDVMIRVIDKKKPGVPAYFNRDYAVEPSIKHPFLGKVPVEALEVGLDIEDYVKAGIFTEVEWKTIHGSHIDLEKELTPNTDEEIKNALVESPIDVLAKRDDKPIFVNPERIAAVLARLEIPALTDQGGREDSGLAAPAEQPVAEEKPQVVDAEEGATVEDPVSLEREKEVKQAPPAKVKSEKKSELSVADKVKLAASKAEQSGESPVSSGEPPAEGASKKKKGVKLPPW